MIWVTAQADADVGREGAVKRRFQAWHLRIHLATFRIDDLGVHLVEELDPLTNPAALGFYPDRVALANPLGESRRRVNSDEAVGFRVPLARGAGGKPRAEVVNGSWQVAAFCRVLVRRAQAAEV